MLDVEIHFLQKLPPTRAKIPKKFFRRHFGGTYIFEGLFLAKTSSGDERFLKYSCELENLLSLEFFKKDNFK